MEKVVTRYHREGPPSGHNRLRYILTLTSMHRFQPGLAIVMKRKSSQNLQDTKLNARCTAVKRLDRLQGKNGRQRRERIKRGYLAEKQKRLIGYGKKQNSSDSENRIMFEKNLERNRS